MTLKNAEAVKEIDTILKRRDELWNRMAKDKLPGLVHEDQVHLMSLHTSLIHRLTPPNSVYRTMLRAAGRKKFPDGKEHVRVLEFEGIIRALRDDLAADRLKSFEEQFRLEVYSDLLTAAEYLNDEIMPDAAAIMAGGVLEDHLRKLCDKHRISKTFIEKGVEKQMLLQKLNDTLASKKHAIYTKAEKSQIDSWLQIRNDAAHGNFLKHPQKEVELMIQGIRHFMARYIT